MKTHTKGGQMKTVKILLLTLCLLTLPAAVRAQLIFTTNNGAITILGCGNAAGALVIPSSTNGHPVTSIASGALQNLPGLTSVVIPDSVTNLGSGAFRSEERRVGKEG